MADIVDRGGRVTPLPDDVERRIEELGLRFVLDFT
jgi:hypothetical protein